MPRGQWSAIRSVDELRAASGFDKLSRSDPRYEADKSYRSAVQRAEYLGRSSRAKTQGYERGYSEAKARRAAGRQAPRDTTSKATRPARQPYVTKSSDGGRLLAIGPRGGGQKQVEAELGKLVARDPAALVDVTVDVATKTGTQTHTFSVPAVMIAGGAGGVPQGIADAFAAKLAKSPKNKGGTAGPGAYVWSPKDLRSIQVSWTGTPAQDPEQEHYAARELAELYEVALASGTAGGFFDGMTAEQAEQVLDEWEAMAEGEWDF